jgi:hypothetical protein
MGGRECVPLTAAKDWDDVTVGEAGPVVGGATETEHQTETRDLNRSLS